MDEQAKSKEEKMAGLEKDVDAELAKPSADAANVLRLMRQLEAERRPNK